MKAFIFANDANNIVTEALRKLLGLLGVDVSPRKPKDCNILVIADGESYINTNNLEISDNAKLIYLEWKDIKKTEGKHNLYFLTYILPTYRIPMESFSIKELARILVGGNQMSRIKDPYNIINNIKGLRLDLGEFTKYLHNYKKYIEDELHGKERLSDAVIEKIVEFDYTSSLLRVPNDIELNILVVENKPDEIKGKFENLKKYFTKINFYFITEQFDLLKKYLNHGEKDKIKKLIKKNNSNGSSSDSKSFDFDQLDLILQDIFLEAEGISGADLVDLYFSLAPQAMVFFLTSMDVETLAAYGYDRKVDRIISKNRIKGLIKYYYERFQELYGGLLWSVFVRAPERKTPPVITDRKSVRELLANIRSWIFEPGILFHGYALPEMVDHEFRHTYGLWKMTNAILVPFYERMELILEDEEIMLLSLAIWLHDIGHRGDEYHYESMNIRDNHASISESLILRSYEAFGLDWLKDYCEKEDCKDCDAEDNRNKIGACKNGGSICSIRRLGLLCRYHQSSAPLTEENLSTLLLKRKMPSPYCIVGMEDFKQEIKGGEQIKDYVSRIKDFEWFGVTIRCLDNFKDENLLHLTGLLRWLDALHTHYEKVGSLSQVKSQFEYLAMREKYCKRRIGEIDNLLQKTETGSEAYLGQLDERFNLDSYSQLIAVQYIHIWRSGMVKDIYGKWFWDDGKGEWNYRIVFQLFEKPLFMTDNKLKKETYNIPKDKHNNSIGKLPIKFWVNHVCKEIIEEEKDNQTIKGSSLFMKYFGEIPLSYWYRDADGKEGDIQER